MPGLALMAAIPTSPPSPPSNCGWATPCACPPGLPSPQTHSSLLSTLSSPLCLPAPPGPACTTGLHHRTNVHLHICLFTHLYIQQPLLNCRCHCPALPLLPFSAPLRVLRGQKAVPPPFPLCRSPRPSASSADQKEGVKLSCPASAVRCATCLNFSRASCPPRLADNAPLRTKEQFS